MMIDGMRRLGPYLNPGEVRVGTLYVLTDVLREFGVVPDPFLARFGLSEAYFQDPDNKIRFADFGSLLLACVAETGCPHFGLLVGERSKISALGVTGFLAGTAPGVGAALNELIANYDLHNRAATPFLKVDSNQAMFGFEVFEKNIPGLEQIYDGALGIACNILSRLMEPGWKPSGVSFRRNRPDALPVYKRVFKVPLSFNAEANAVIFPASDLQARVCSADPLERRYFQQHVASLRQHANPDFRERAYRALVLLLAANDCTQENLARQLAVHPRTLNRRLKEAGTNFRELRDRVRHTTACQMLRDSRLSIEAISSSLGYSEASSFNRAFSGWEGVPPASWRKSRQIEKA